MSSRKIVCGFLLAVLPLIAPAAAHSRDLEEFAIPGGLFQIDWRGEFSVDEQQKLRTWLDGLAVVVRKLHGELPRDTIRIAFKPYRGGGAVPFAQVLRNEPEGILFYVNPEQSLAAFVNDWTAYHEFSHLFIPFPGRADIWFSEGLASYYQNILQLRGGLLSTDEVRQRFAAAFQRGRDDTSNADLTLGELSARMRERRAFMRVYWSGAVYFLQADLQLRALPARDGKPASLDAVLRHFGECCLIQGEEMTGREQAATFDRIAGTQLFTELYDRFERSHEMPPYEALLASPAFTQLLASNVP